MFKCQLGSTMTTIVDEIARFWVIWLLNEGDEAPLKVLIFQKSLKLVKRGSFWQKKLINNDKTPPKVSL